MSKSRAGEASAAPAAASALQLLQLLGRRSAPQPAAVLARDLGLPRSTTYKLLGVLQDAGFVTHSPTTKRWGLGVAAYELGSAYSRQQPLRRVAQGVMTELAERTGQCAHLAVLHGTDVLYIIEERPLGRAPLVTDVGVRLPATATASGLAILAELPASQIRALFPSSDVFVQRQQGAVVAPQRGAPTSATHGHSGVSTSHVQPQQGAPTSRIPPQPGAPTSLVELRSRLAAVRARGHAWEYEAVTPGFASLGCAVLDHNGLPAAAVAVTWEMRQNVDEASLVAAVSRAAADLGTRLRGENR